MTESPFPFSSEEPATYAEEAEEAGSKRPLVLAVAGLAVVALAGGYLLLGGSDAAEEEFVPVARAPRAAAPAPVVPVEPQTVPVEFDGVTGRNPFKALYVAPATGGGGGGAATAPTTTTVTLGSPTTLVGGTGTTSGTTTTTKPATTTTTAPTTKPAPTGTTAPAPAKPVQTAPKPIWIEMPATDTMGPEELKAHLADGTYRFTTADTAGAEKQHQHVVKPGDTFAQYFKLVKLVYRGDRGQCAELRFGEEPFFLCEADSINF